MKHWFRGKYLSYWLIAISILLAIIGYINYFNRYNVPFTVPDLAYAILRLFTIDGSFESTVVNLPLNIARFLAPISLATAIIQGVMSLFSSKIRLQKMRNFKGHIIVCGDATNNIDLIQNIGNQGKDYILLNTKLPQNDDDDGLLKVQMALPDPTRLKSIAFYHARYVIVSYENDTTSLLFLKDLLREIDLQKIIKPLDIIVLFNHPEWMEYSADLEILEQLRDNAINHQYLNLRYLNYKDAAIRKIMIRHAPDVYKPVTAIDAAQEQIAIVGFNNIGERLIINLALHSHYINHKKLHIHLFADSTDGFEPFVAKYQLRKMLEFSFNPLSSLVFFDEVLAAVYLTEKDETRQLKAFSAIQMNENLKELPKIVLTETEHSVASLIKKFPVTIENISAQATVFQNIIDESIDKFAEIIHNDYLQKLEKVDSNLPTQRPWHLLSDEVRNRSRVQADHIMIKLRSLNCTTVPLSDPTPVYDIATDELLEALSKTEHDRWCAYMFYKGWKPGTTRNDTKKTHTDLITYEALSEAKKDLDRNTIKNIPELVKLLGNKIIQISDSSLK